MAVNPAAATSQVELQKKEESKQTGQLGPRTVAHLSHSPIGSRSIVVTTDVHGKQLAGQKGRSGDDSPYVVRSGGLGGIVFPAPVGAIGGLRPSFGGSLSLGSSPMLIPKGNQPPREPVGKRLPLERQSSGPKYGSAPSKVTVEMGTQTEENN